MADAARHDQETLVRALVRRARLALEAEGGFTPAAAVITAEGEIRHLRGVGGESSGDASARVQSLLAALQQFAEVGEIRAAALCYDGRARVRGEETDAVCVSVEHREAEALQVVLPYTLLPPVGGEGPRAVDLGPYLMAPAAPQIFEAG